MRHLLLVLLLSIACTGVQSEQCKKICQQETDCATRRNALNENFPYDLDECVAACVALEHDKEGRKLVEKHLACAKKANGDCKQLMLCR